MDLFAIDDSRQDKPTRDGVRPLVAVGGLHVPGDNVRDLESGLDALCSKVGCPTGDEFKWSPNRGTWMRAGLVKEARQEFFLDALRLAAAADATAVVAISDTKCRRATSEAKSPGEDVVLMFLERAHAQIPGGGYAIALFDRPGGSRKHEDEFPLVDPWLAALRDVLLEAGPPRLGRIDRLQAVAPRSAR